MTEQLPELSVEEEILRILSPGSELEKRRRILCLVSENVRLGERVRALEEKKAKEVTTYKRLSDELSKTTVLSDSFRNFILGCAAKISEEAYEKGRNQEKGKGSS